MTAMGAAATAYDQAGEGPDVVLIHGLGLHRAMWQWTAPGLTGRYRVLAYDLAGHGASAIPAAGFSLDGFVAQLAELADTLGLTRYSVVGFSLGGMVAQAFALAFPQRVRALAVLHSAFDRSAAERAAILERVTLAEHLGPAATVEKALQRWFTPAFAAAHPEVIDLVRGWVLANDPRAFAAAYRVLALCDQPLAARMREIACPTLVVTGEEDYGNSPDMARRMVARLQRAELTILPGLRHMALAEQPDAVLRVLMPFLEAHAGEE